MSDQPPDHALDFLLAFDGRVHHLDKGFKRKEPASDHWHRAGADAGRPYQFKDVETLINDFFDEVERVLRARGIGMVVVAVEEKSRPK